MSYHSTKTSLIALTIASILSPSLNGQTAVNYNFNSLTAGTYLANPTNGYAAGQDNWHGTDVGSVPSSATTVETSTLGIMNGVKVLYDRSSSSGGSTANYNAKDFGTAYNAAGNISTLTITFNAASCAAANGGSGGGFNFYQHSSGITPFFADTSSTLGVGIGVEMGGGGTSIHFRILPAAKGTIVGSPWDTTLNLNHWYTLQLVVDPTGLGGHGSGSLYLTDLTQNAVSGSTAWSAPSGLQNIDMNLQNATGANAWTAVTGVSLSLGGAGLEVQSLSITSTNTSSHQATSYYVSPTGSNANNGTSVDTPFKNLQQAADAMLPGDVCNIRSGVYRETVTIKSSNLTFQPYNPTPGNSATAESVTITGTEAIPSGNWVVNSTSTAGTTWSAAIPSGNGSATVDQTQVFQGTGTQTSLTMKPEASWPSFSGTSGTTYPWRNSRLNHPTNHELVDWSYLDSGAFSTVASFTDAELPSSYSSFLAGTLVNIMAGPGWGMANSTTVTSFDGTTVVTNSNNNGFTAGNEYYLIGKKQFMAHTGDWFTSDASTLYFLGTASPPQNVEVKRRLYGFDLAGRSGTTLNNLNFFACTINTDASSTNSTLNGLVMNYLQHDRQVNWGNLSGIVLYDNSTLRNSELAWASGALLSVAGNNVKVINNYLHDSGYVPQGIPMFGIGGSGNLISHNTLKNSGHALMGGVSPNSIIEYNDMSNAMVLCSDGGVFYSSGPGGNIVFRYNLLHDSLGPVGHTGSGLVGFYLDNLNSNWVVHHNIIWNINSTNSPGNSASGFALWMNARTNTNMVFNNTCWNCNGGSLGTSFLGDGPTGDKFYNNIFNGKPLGVGDTLGKMDFRYNYTSTTDPGFVNAAAANFQPATGATNLINMGTPVPGITDVAPGIGGNTPDIGALQSDGTNWAVTTGLNCVGCNFTSPPNPDPTYASATMSFVNKVQDPSFESGTLSSWTTTGNLGLINSAAWFDPHVRSGGYGLQFGGGNSQITQVVTGLQPNKKYIFQCGIQKSDSNATVTLGVTSSPYPNREVIVIGSGSSTGVWDVQHSQTAPMMYAVPFVTGTNSTQATIYVKVTRATGAQVVSATPPTLTTTAPTVTVLSTTNTDTNYYGNAYPSTGVYLDDLSVTLDEGNSDPLPDGMPTICYPFNETSGTVAHDATTRGSRDATLANGATFRASQAGYGNSFAPSASGTGNGTATGPATVVPTNNTTSFSMAYWIKINNNPSGSWPSVISQNTGGQGWWVQINSGVSGGNYSVALFDCASVFGGLYTVIPSSTWTHMAFTVDRVNGIVSYYQNGAFMVSYPLPSGAIAAAGNFMLHWGGGTSDFQVDDFAGWDYALSATEITDIASRDPSMVMRLNLNETAGASKAWDATGQGNNGTLSGLSTSSCWIDDSLDLVHTGSTGSAGVTCPSTLAVPATGSGSFTVSYWLKVNSNGSDGNQYIPAKTDGTLGWWCVLSGTGGTYTLTFNAKGSGDASTFSYPTTLPASGWVHVAFAVDRTAGTVTAYQNGVSLGSQSATLGSLTVTNPVSFYVQKNADIQVSDMRLYTRALAWYDTQFLPQQIASAPYASYRIPDNTLTALTMNSGSLSPAFSSDQLDYTASVPYATTSVTVNPTVTVASSSVTVNGVTVSSGTASAAIPLSVGTNNISIAVTAQDGVTTANYTIAVTRLDLVPQTITFGALPVKYYGDPTFPLTATASSALTVSYGSSNPSVATISGNTVVIHGAGSTTITASQSGDATYAAAADVPQVLTVNKASGSAALGNLAATYNGSQIAATATTTPSGLTVSFTYNGSSTPPVNAGSYTVVGTINDTNYWGSTSGTLVISKATAPIVLGGLNPTYNGSAKSATATTTPVGLTASFTYNGSTTTPVNAGSYTVVGTINDTNYQGTSSGTLVISKATATVALASLAQTYDGSAKSATATTTPTGLTVSFTYNSSSTTPVNAGSYTVVGTINDTNYQGSSSGTLVISKATATVALSSLAQTYDGSTKSATATTTPADLSVLFTYNGSSIAPINAGSYAVVGTVNDANYQGSSSGTLVISKATATVALSSLAQTYDGSTKSATATTTPTDLTISFTYDGSSTAPVNAGSYAVVGTINDTNHQGASSGTLVISKATATVALSSLAQTYDGSAKSATATTTPADLSVLFTYNGSSTSPVNAGSYTVVGTINDTNYQGSSSGTLVISKATATVALASLAQTYNGSTKSATATTTPVGLTASFTYNGSTTTPVNAGSYTVVGTINDTNYQGTSSGTLVISKATATVALASLAQTYDGSAKSATATTTPADLSVLFTYNGSSTPPVNAESYTVVGTINDTNYQGSSSGTLVISKATATVALSSLAQTYDGSAKSATATTTPADLSVLFTYNGSSTAPVNAGSYTVVGTINDTNYQGSSSGTLVISKAAATLALASLAQNYDGSAKSATADTTPSGLATLFTYDGSSTSPINAGSYAVAATINDTNYQGSSSGTLVISKAAATVALASLAQTYDGSSKSATSDTNPVGLTVSFTYNSSSTAPINAGSYAVVGTINDTNYQGSSSGTMVISKAAATVALASLAQTYDGGAKSATADTTPVGLTVSFTYDGSPTAPINAGSYAVVGTINDTNYQGSSSGTLAVSKAAATVALASLTQTYDGNAKPATANTTPAGLTVLFTYNGSSTAPVNAGTYAVVGAISDTNYQGTSNGTLQIYGESITAWRERMFTAAEILSGAASDSADPDGDGLTDLAEYALGTDPHVSNQLAAAVRGPDGLTLTFTRPNNLPDVSYAAESSDDMIHWSPVTIILVTDGPVQTMRAVDPLTSGDPTRRFMRLKFTR